MKTLVPALSQTQQELPICRPEVLHFHDGLCNSNVSYIMSLLTLSHM